MKARANLSLARRWRKDERAVAAVEFALIVPILLIVYVGGYGAAQAVGAYRKLSDTTVELANVTAQYTNMACADLDNVMDASAQIMAPYPTQNLSIVLSEIQTDTSGAATVAWSYAYNSGVALTRGSPFQMPSGMAAPSTDYLLVQTTYSWTPVVQFNSTGSIPMVDQIYMLPRQSASIPYPGTCVIT